MDKINFQNLPVQTTPINGNNLNLLQTNIDNGKVDKSLSIYNGDLDNLKTTGFYMTSTNTTNKPGSLNYYIEVIAENNNGVIQMATARNSNDLYVATYKRICINGTWHEWHVFPMITTNANGTAIQFEDGTMICTNRIPKESFKQTTSSNRTVQGLTIYRSKVFTWTFPVEFVASAGVNVSMLPNTGDTLSIYTCASRGITRTAVSIEMYSLNDFLENSPGYNSLVDVSLRAIGRWRQ